MLGDALQSWPLEFLGGQLISAKDQIWVDLANQLSPGANLAWSQGQLVTLLLQYENFGKTLTSGVDVDVKSRMNLGDGGVLRLGLQGTYAIELREWDIDAGKYRPNKVGLRGGVNTSANVPRWRAVFSGSLEQGPWTWGSRLNYTSARGLSNDETDAATWAAAGCAARLTTRGDAPCNEPETIIATASAAYTGFKNTRLTAIIGNAFGETGRTSLRDGYAIRPTTVKIGAEYKF